MWTRYSKELAILCDMTNAGNAGNGAFLPHLLPQPLDVDRVLADQHRRQSRDGGALDFAAAAEADAGDAFAGLDLHHGEGDVRVGVLAVGDGLVTRPAEFLGGDAGDLHAAASCRGVRIQRAQSGRRKRTDTGQ